MSGRRSPGGSRKQRARRQAGRRLEAALRDAGMDLPPDVLERVKGAYEILRADLDTLPMLAGEGDRS